MTQQRGAAMARERAQESQERSESGGAHVGAEQTGASRPQNGGERGVARSQRGLETPTLFTSPFSLMRQLMEDLDRLVVGSGTGGAPTRRMAGTDALWVPSIEVAEQDGKLVVRADVPGVNRDQ